MDDYSVNSLIESKNEWCARLVNLLTPAVISGIKSIFEESWNLCIANEEQTKYLMTFQTFLSRVPKWNEEIIKTERKRILDVTTCPYLEDMITCVHIIHMKALTVVRVGQHQKQVNINIPSINNFIHKLYILVARKIYTNVYLFEVNIPPLDIQRHNRELELIIKESILNAIRESIPVEDILKEYLSETQEEEVIITDDIIETPKVETIETPKAETIETPKAETIETPKVETIETLKAEPVHMVTKNNEPLVVSNPIMPDKISFSDIDFTMDESGNQGKIEAPKTIERLERISQETHEKRKQEEESEDKLVIGDEISLEDIGIKDLNGRMHVKPLPVIDIETL